MIARRLEIAGILVADRLFVPIQFSVIWLPSML